MTNDTCSIPVKATMRRQPDGTYSMADAVYKEIPVDYIAELLVRTFGGIPMASERKCGDA